MGDAMSNKQRADWGRKGVEAGQPDNSATADTQTALVDALANMHHFAERWGADWRAALDSAEGHFQAELAEEEVNKP